MEGTIRMPQTLFARLVPVAVALCLFLAGTGEVAAEPSDAPQSPGRLEGTGTHFQLSDSRYLNLTLDSSAPITLILGSVPEMVRMYIEAAPDALSTTLTLSGFLPSTIYHKYEDDYHNHAPFTTDESGNYTYTQDLSMPHRVFIQPRASTKFLRNDATGGDCTSIGIWDSTTKTCTLTGNVSETIQIAQGGSGITLDGNGWSTIGSGTGIGVYVTSNSVGVTIKNLTVTGYAYGIELFNSSGNNVTGTTLTSNQVGLSLQFLTGSTIAGNTISSSTLRGIELYSAPSNTLTGNTVASTVSPYYEGIYLQSSNLNMLTANTITSNAGSGISLYFSTGNTITGNTISANVNYGISDFGAGPNTITGNTISGNGIGIAPTNYSTLTDNSVSMNTASGIVLRSSTTVTGNRISSNTVGIQTGGVNNMVYNNCFIDNPTQAFSPNGNNVFNLAAPTGGNYWSNYDTLGEGCYNLNGDSFCDAPYVFYGGQDNLPRTTQPPCGNQPPVANAGADRTVDEGTVVTLVGSASTGQDLAFNWSQLAGPPVALSDPASAMPTFAAPLFPGGFGSQTLTFQLQVMSGGQSDSDTVDITVKNVNHPPEASAGADQLVHEGSQVTLDGTHSWDPDGDLFTYTWAQTAGTPVALNGAGTSYLTFTAPLVPGGVSASEILVFQLIVSDGVLSSLPAAVRVVVEQVNHPPTADAGADQTRLEGAVVTLDGSTSSDPDGDPMSYTWSQVGSGPTVGLSDPHSPSPTFTAPPVGPGGVSLQFQLVLSDGVAASVPDVVTITVQNINDPPKCELGWASQPLLWPPTHKLIPVGIVGVTDPDNDSVTITITAVTQDEPVYGLDDGDTSPDAVLQGAQVLLRAERSGVGNGRVYRVYFTADDNQGGACTGAVTVEVPLSTSTAAVDDGQLYDSTQPAERFTAFLNATGFTLFLDGSPPTATTPVFLDSASLKFAGGNPWREVGTWPAIPALSEGTLSMVGDFHAWLGLKNSDDIGTRFDLRAEVFKNTTLVASGEVLCVTDVTRNPNLAKEVMGLVGPFSPVSFDGHTDVLAVKLLARIGTNGAGAFCGGHSSAVGLRVYFDAAGRPSRLHIRP